MALVYARTGAARYRTKARNAIMSAIGTQRGGSSLAVGRNAAAYVLAADLINLRNMSRQDDHATRNWLTRLCTGVNPGNPRWPTLVRTSKNASSNWGAFATASRIAIDLYLGDKADLKRAARIHAAYADRSAYPRGKPWGAYFQPTADFDPGHWACDPARWVAINPPCTKGGNDLDGAFVEDISREPAQQTRLPQPADSPGVSYSWETLQAVMFQAELLRRAGYPNLWTRSDHALKRATELHRPRRVVRPVVGDAARRLGDQRALRHALPYPPRAVRAACWLHRLDQPAVAPALLQDEKRDAREAPQPRRAGQ